MSRTYRRKNGNRWWDEKDFTFALNSEGQWIHNPSDIEIQWYKDFLLSKYQKRDVFFGKCFLNKAVKEESNVNRRTSKRKEIRKITLENYEEFEYNRDKELLVKSIRRYYD